MAGGAGAIICSKSPTFGVLSDLPVFVSSGEGKGAKTAGGCTVADQKSRGCEAVRRDMLLWPEPGKKWINLATLNQIPPGAEFGSYFEK